jgi:diguanylate cyclase (GGDEF)-like protein
MNWLYPVTLCVALVFMNYIGIRSRRQKSPLGKVLRRVLIAVTATVVTSVAAIYAPTENVALFMQCAHYASTEWLLIYLLCFMEKYTEDTWSRKSAKIVVYSLGLFNMVSLLLNCLFHHVATCSYTDIGNGFMVYTFATKKPWYQIHLYFAYFLVFCNVSVLCGQIFKTTKFYRKKYSVALLMLSVTVAVDAICTIGNYPLDYSIYIYIMLACFLTYFSVYYVPQGLITKTLSYVVADTSSAVVCCDGMGKCIYANEVAKKLYGNPEELSQIEPQLCSELGTDDFLHAEERSWEKEISEDGRTLYYDMNFGKLYDERNNYIGCYFLMRDKTEDMEKLEREHYHSTHDMLTGLYNREYFYEAVQKLLAKHPDVQYDVISINIRDFKLVNDLFGFEMGDTILKRIAEIMIETLPGDTTDHACARMESDHFVFCIRKELFQEEKLNAVLGEVLKLIPQSEYQMMIHAGVYEVQSDDSDVSVMCDRANIAIATIKDNYQCRIAYYDEQLMERVMYEKRLVSEFEPALEKKQFVMFLQPQVLADGTVLGAEALVRWIHPERGMVSPGDFIGVFEKAGLIYRLDEYIWDLAARKLKEWKDNGWEDLHISVNISAKDFYYLDIYKTFTALVEKYDIAPRMLKLEITETALMMDLEKQLVLIEKLRNYGFGVEIDDFGSGYSSLNMLKDIPADVLKIDMGFLQETQNRERSGIILRTIVELAKQLRMTVITEGVESKEQVDYMTKAGCDMFQGYYFARPIAVEEFEERYMKEKTE